MDEGNVMEEAIAHMQKEALVSRVKARDKLIYAWVRLRVY